MTTISILPLLFFLYIHLTNATTPKIKKILNDRNTIANSPFQTHTTTDTEKISLNNNNVNTNYPLPPPSHRHRHLSETKTTPHPDSIKTLSTAFEAPSGSYGNMFDVRTRSLAITIVNLDFYTDMKKNVTYEIYTRPGSYLSDGKNGLEGWKRVANGSVMGAGKGRGTTVPLEEFTPVEILEDSVQSFYITLLTPDIRYTWGDSVGHVFSSNGELKILEGSGVGDYPMGKNFYAPRVWNGALHYIVPSHSLPPSSAPSSTPTTTMQPTALKIHPTTVTLPFVIEHPSTRGIPSIVSAIDTSLRNCISQLLLPNNKTKNDDSYTLQSLATNHKLTLISVLSVVPTMEKTGRTVNDKDKTRTSITSAITMGHDIRLPSDRVRDALLIHAEDFLSSLDFDVKFYLGPRVSAVEFMLSLPLGEMKEMNNEESEEFERVLFMLLADDTDGVKLSSVVMGGQTMRPNNDTNVTNEKTRRKQRRQQRDLRWLQEETDNNDGGRWILDVHTTITGEYQPPPEVNMEAVVSESLNHQMNALMDTLNSNPAFSLHLTGPPHSVSLMENDTVTDDHNNKTILGDEEQTTDSIFSSYLFVTGLIGVSIVVIAGGVVAFFAVRKHQQKQAERTSALCTDCPDWSDFDIP